MYDVKKRSHILYSSAISFWDGFSVFLQRKPDTVVEILPKVYSIHFGVQAGFGVQNLKLHRSGLGVYFAKAGVESEEKFQTPYISDTP